MNLDKMSLGELRQLERELTLAIASFDKRRRDQALEAIAATAKEHGFTLKELLGSAPSRGLSPVAPKYAKPGDPSVTWSGRGRSPVWFREAIAKGATRESLAV